MAERKIDEDPEAEPRADRRGARGDAARARRAARAGARHRPEHPARPRAGGRDRIAGRRRDHSRSTCASMSASRVPRHVEAAAYFVVAESLANAAKHAGAIARARSASGATPIRTGIIVEVTDDGDGGADPAAGSGLSGLRKAGAPRSTAGSTVSSPAGGPTSDQRGDPVRVVIAEDLALLRDGLTRLLRDSGCEVVAAVDNGDALVDAVDRGATPTSRSSTCGCRRRSPTRACARRSRRASASPGCRC